MPSQSPSPAKSPAETVFLFVYGTLKRGEPGNELMKNSRFVSVVMRTGLTWVRTADYPSAVRGETIDYVVGEIWEVPLVDLPMLDEYEGQNYERVLLPDSNLYAYLLKEREADRFVETT